MEVKSKRKSRWNQPAADDRGLTLVEIICAVAIFSLVAATIGGVLVFSSKSYRNGSTETVVQQEAQFAANRIGDIIQDSVSVNFLEETHETGDCGRLVMNSGTTKYVIELAAGGNQLFYGEGATSDADDAIPVTDLLAENIISFHVDTAKFDAAKTVRVDMIVEADDRQFVMSYNMTARNDEVTLEAIPAIRTAAIVVESKIILEPGQTYTLPVNVSGSSRGIKAISGDDSQVHVTYSSDSVTIEVEKSAGLSSETVDIDILTNENGGDGNALARATVTVQIRRVDEMKLFKELLSGEDGKKDAKYKIYSSMIQKTPYMAKKVGASWDNDYKNPYAVQWNYESNLVINGVTANFETYFKVVEIKEDIDTPYIVIQLKKDLVVGATLTVEGVSKHAAVAGGNKSGEPYNTSVKASVDITGPTLSGEETVILEPGESYETTLPVAACNITTTPTGLSSNGTTIHYENGKITITLGKNETGDSNGRIKVELRALGDTDASNVKIINIQVRRVNGITLVCKQLTGDGHPVKEPLLSGADYQFYTHIDGTNLAKDSLEAEADYLPNPYAVEFSWEFRLNGTKVTGLPGISGSVIWDEYEYLQKTGSYTKEYSHEATNPGNKYFRLVDLGTNSEHPCINFALKQDFPANAELIVTARALHPAGKDDDGTIRNHKGVAYVEGDIIATATLEGEHTVGIETAKDTIIVEPNEGSDIRGDEHELAIPIYVTGSISGIDAEIIGNSDKNTRIIDFDEGDNPQKDESNSKVWWVWLAIGKNETGKNDTGKMTLNLTAYGYDGDDNKIVLDEIEPTLALRRVTEVNVDADSVNYSAGGTITLTADVLGYGKDGTEYFAQQKQGTNEEYAPRWDATNYVSPYAWEWTIIEKGGSSKKLENSSYIDKSSIKYVNDENTQTVTFKLTKSLPAGTIIRATSLHASGENKSGKSYDDVYGEYKIGEIIDPDDPFDDSEVEFLSNILRGQDYSSFQDSHETANFDWSVKDKCEGKWFMRTREILGKDSNGNILYGPWTTYRRLWEKGSSKKLNAVETRSLIANKRYQVQMAFMAIDPDTKTIYWPYDTSLSAKGSGTGFEGYYNNWDESTQFTSEEAYSSTYNVGRAYVGFKVGDTCYESYGSLESPVILHPGESFQIDLWGYTLEYSHYQQKCYARVQELVGNTWVEVGNKGWSIQDRSSFLLIKDIQDSAKGTYRISFKVVDNEGADWTEWNGDIWNPLYDRYKNTEYLLCGSNGTKGYLYIRIE